MYLWGFLCVIVFVCFFRLCLSVCVRVCLFPQGSTMVEKYPDGCIYLQPIGVGWTPIR